MDGRVGFAGGGLFHALLSRPRGAVGSGTAAVESAAVSAVALRSMLVSPPRIPCVSRLPPVSFYR